MKVYSVTVGNPGYIPWARDWYKTKAKASDSAQWWADTYREDEYHTYGKVYGNKHEGYEVIPDSPFKLRTFINITAVEITEEEWQDYCELDDS